MHSTEWWVDDSVQMDAPSAENNPVQSGKQSLHSKFDDDAARSSRGMIEPLLSPFPETETTEGSHGDRKWVEDEFVHDLSTQHSSNNSTQPSRMMRTCHRPSMYIFYGLNVLSFSIGILCLLYGFTVDFKKNNAKNPFSIHLLIWSLFTTGVFGVLSATLGFLGIWDYWRFGMTISAYLCVPLACTFFTTFMMMQFNQSGILDFIQNNSQTVCLNSNKIKLLESHWETFATLLGFLSLFEVVRSWPLQC
mmetsp:Transcript_38027/g.88466  ORF Transcript_38027/g.88466 Transcript_38027/m.88466 type:complete len:249 (-) Transcript_38027:505-1251(-)